MLYFSILVSVWVAGAVGQIDETSRVAQLLKDAQAANIASLDHGTMKARLTYRTATGRTDFGLDVTVNWDGPNAFWLYTVADLDGAVTRRTAQPGTVVAYRGCRLRTEESFCEFSDKKDQPIPDDRVPN